MRLLNVRKMRLLNVHKMRPLNVRKMRLLNVRKNTLNVCKMRLNATDIDPPFLVEYQPEILCLLPNNTYFIERS